MLNTTDKTIVKNYCDEQIKEKDKIIVKSIAELLTEHYALYEIMDYIKNELNISEENILYAKSTYMSEWHGHKRIGKTDTYYGNVYLHQYIYHKAFGVSLETLGKYIIHHIDGNKHNNEPSNLWLFYNTELHRKFHCVIEKNPSVSINQFTKNWIEDNLSGDNSQELEEYLKLLLRVENTKKCLSLDGLDNAM